jgi:hypothetical protein
MLKWWLACLLKEAKNKRKCKGFEGYLLDSELLPWQLAVDPNEKYGARHLRNLDLVISEALTSRKFSTEVGCLEKTMKSSRNTSSLHRDC